MMRRKHLLLLICCVAMLRLEGNMQAVANAGAAERFGRGTAPMVVPSEVPATAFADSELRLRFVCHGREGVAWQASAVRRPFASGVVMPKDGRLEVRFRTPPVKEGVSLLIKLAAGDAVCKILVFGKDPLVARRQWAEELGIVLFDPSGETAKALESVQLPFRRATGLGPLGAVTEGVVVVGEGIHFDANAGLDRVLCQVARRSVPVILLRPASGEFTVSDPGPERFQLLGGNVAERVDPHTASDLRRSIGLRVSGEGNGPVLRITDQLSDYAWGDFRFGDGRGRLCCVTWNLLDSWETSPAPRFFFVDLLEIVSSGRDLPGGKPNE